MTALEPWLIKLSLYLSGLSQKCIVAGIKKWKETRDQQKAAADTQIIQEHELAKSIQSKIEQQITVSIREVRLTPELIQEILSLETNPLIKSQLSEKFLLSDISPEYIEELFASQNPALLEHRDTLHMLGLCWLDAMDKVVANNHQLQGIISFRGFRLVRSDLKNLEAEVVRANLRAEQAESNAEKRHDELLAAFSKIPGYDLSASKDAEDSIPEHLKSQNQRRFDRAKKYLTVGSVFDAEREFRGLIEDIEALRLDHDPDLLLLRSYLNLASSLWEQSRQNDAAIFFDKAYALNPNDWRSKRGRAFALISRNRVDDALAIFEEIRQLRPNESEHLCNQAWILKNNERVGEAIQILEATPFEDVYYHSILAFCYARAERYEDAEKSARKALQCEPGSETAQTALAFAIGFPIIQKRTRRETVQFAPSEEERSRLLDAISHAETAADTLRKKGRLNVLFDVLSNLAAFYPAVGDCDKAAIAAKEALQIAPNDTTILKNLWCIQMRLFKFDDAAATAARLQELDNFMEWWDRRGEALVQADRAQEVIDSWQTSKDDPRFTGNSDVIGIAARALSRLHRTDEGLDLLNQSLEAKPDDPVLLLERAQLLEGLGNLDAARNDMVIAVQNAGKKHILSQAMVSKGMFHFRRGEWKDAAKAFKELGGENVHNPLFPNYLISLFNTGEFRESLNLAEKAISETKEFVEDFYVIAARCHHICENFPRARALLEVLVSKSAVREFEHRKLLAWACWRMDDLPQTYDIVRKALKLNPEDLDCLILVTAVCTLLGKHKGGASLIL